MNSKRDWGWALVGTLFLLLGPGFLWSARSALL
jgi:hypothetical protein